MSTPLAPRKTPSQPRAQATYVAILEAAAQIIAAGGLAAFNTNAVAMRAGVSIGSLYQYFPNKDSLMVALIHRQQTQQVATVARAVAAVGNIDLAGTIDMIVRAAMQHHHDDSLLASAIDHEEARLPMTSALDAYLDQGGALVRALLERHRAELDPSCDLDRAARTLPVLVRAVGDRWANLSPPQMDAAHAEAVRAVLGYLQCGSAAH